MNTGRDREVDVQRAVQDRHPAQWQTQLARITQDETWRDFEILEIEVGLIETIEKNEPIGAMVTQTTGHARNGAEERAEFHCHRNIHRLSHGRENVEIERLYFHPRYLRVRRDVVHIHLQGISAGLFD